ncbi:hypothetical protein CHS0354_029506 [Potamilus streckersoni]|uniref:Uncharacterized protein n=1 Tax=Potamilus streckersoni TaxID=2493646 RepID=A0AAE0S7A9_9BIVA|nr:hypothetical protein CHS0354_029506 [Potamilus streckersoni]
MEWECWVFRPYEYTRPLMVQLARGQAYHPNENSTSSPLRYMESTPLPGPSSININSDPQTSTTYSTINATDQFFELLITKQLLNRFTRDYKEKKFRPKGKKSSRAMYIAKTGSHLTKPYQKNNQKSPATTLNTTCNNFTLPVPYPSNQCLTTPDERTPTLLETTPIANKGPHKTKTQIVNFITDIRQQIEKSNSNEHRILPNQSSQQKLATTPQSTKQRNYHPYYLTLFLHSKGNSFLFTPDASIINKLHSYQPGYIKIVRRKNLIILEVTTKQQIKSYLSIKKLLGKPVSIKRHRSCYKEKGKTTPRRRRKPTHNNKTSSQRDNLQSSTLPNTNGTYNTHKSRQLVSTHASNKHPFIRFPIPPTIINIYPNTANPFKCNNHPHQISKILKSAIFPLHLYIWSWNCRSLKIYQNFQELYTPPQIHPGSSAYKNSNSKELQKRFQISKYIQHRFYGTQGVVWPST